MLVCYTLRTATRYEAETGGLLQSKIYERAEENISETVFTTRTRHMRYISAHDEGNIISACTIGISQILVFYIGTTVVLFLPSDNVVCRGQEVKVEGLTVLP